MRAAAGGILLVGMDAGSAQAVREALADVAPVIPAPVRWEDAPAAIRKRPAVAILAFRGGGEAALALVADVRGDLPGVTLVALAPQADAELLRAAMRAGFRELVVLPGDADALRRVVAEARPPEPAEDAGTILACWGAKGGVGTTTLTLNLAAEIAPVQRTCVVDLDFSAGDVAAMLDVEPRATMTDVLRNLDRLDERLLAGMVTVHASRLHVLAQPSDLSRREEPTGEGIARVLGIVAHAYHYVFVDCGSRLDEATLTTAAVADRILLVTGQDVPSVRNTSRRLQLLRTMGLGTDHVQVLLNGYDPRNGGVSPEVIAENLGRAVEVVVGYDRTVTRAVNEGQLLRSVDAKSPAALAIAGAIGVATGVPAPPPERESRRSLGWIFGRSG